MKEQKRSFDDFKNSCSFTFRWSYSESAWKYEHSSESTWFRGLLHCSALIWKVRIYGLNRNAFCEAFLNCKSFLAKSQNCLCSGLKSSVLAYMYDLDTFIFIIARQFLGVRDSKNCSRFFTSVSPFLQASQFALGDIGILHHRYDCRWYLSRIFHPSKKNTLSVDGSTIY